MITLIMFAETDFLTSWPPLCWLFPCCLPFDSRLSEGGRPPAPVSKALASACPKFSIWTFCLLSCCMDGAERWALLLIWEVGRRGAEREAVGGLPLGSGKGLGGGLGLKLIKMGYFPGPVRVISDTWASSLMIWLEEKPSRNVFRFLNSWQYGTNP